MITYLVQMIICSGLLYGYYHFFLKNERFHRYNRYYLLCIIFLSIVLPLFKIPVYVSEQESKTAVLQSLASINLIQNATPGRMDATEINSSISTTTQLWFGLYKIVVLFFLIKFVIAMTEIYKLKATHITKKIGDITIIDTDHPNSPFSFFKWLFWNNKLNFQSEKGQQVFRHELYHIKKKHTLDILLLEIILSLFWINPVFYFIRRELKIIQEFLADQYACAKETESGYVELLLMQSFGTHQFSLVNPFFNHQLKRRITMLTSSKKPAYQYLRKLMVLPLVAVAVLLFAFTYKNEFNASKEPVKDQGPTVVKITQKSNVQFKPLARIKDTIPIKSHKEFKYDTEKKNYYLMDEVTVVSFGSDNTAVIQPPKNRIDISASYPGGSNAWKNYLEKNLCGDVPMKNGARPGIYNVRIKFMIEPNGSLSNFEPITDEGYGMEQEAVRVLAKSDKWKPALNNKYGETKPVRAYRIQQFSFRVIDNTKPANSSAIAQ